MKRNYDDWLKAYMAHTAQSESPDAFHFWAGVAAVAGALRRRVWIDQNQFQWTPNFYIVLVGPPGVAAKSTSIRQSLSILEQVEGIAFGPSSMTWQALTEALQNARETIDVPGYSEPETMSCLTIGVSEFGTFFDPDNRELIDVLVDMWDGQKGVWRRKTKTQGDTTILNPWLNIIACTTPAWLRANFPEEMIGGGLTSRIIFVYGDRKRQLIAYPAEHVEGVKYRDEVKRLAEDLRSISNIVGEFHLEPSALEWGRAWYADLWSGKARSSNLSSERFDGYMARKQAHIHKLAIVLAAAQRSDRVIRLGDITAAESIVTALEPDMLRVFNSIGVAPTAKAPQTLTAIIKNNKEISNQKLWRMCMTTMSQDDYVSGLKGAFEAGFIKQEKRAGETFYIYLGED